MFHCRRQSFLKNYNQNVIKTFSFTAGKYLLTFQQTTFDGCHLASEMGQNHPFWLKQ